MLISAFASANSPVSKPALKAANTVVSEAEARWESIPHVESSAQYAPMPELSQFSSSAAFKKMEKATTVLGEVSVQRMFSVVSLGDFIAGIRAKEWAKRQLSHPKVIVISGGAVSAKRLATYFKDQPEYFEQLGENEYISRLPIVVKYGASLVLSDDSNVTLKLSKQRGAFISISGNFFSRNARVEGWDEKCNCNASFETEKNFRPFFVSWAGSEVYIVDSHFASLGYNKSKSHGVTFSSYVNAVTKIIGNDLPLPTGWILNSTFEDLYFGFYCYEAENIVLLGNTYKDNIVYGIDPHDRSSHLVIANNTVYGTREKHGIIISREVNDSWIVGNTTFNNGRSGIVLDRSSHRNTVTNNTVYSNLGDGITLYESSDNLLRDNDIYLNHGHGVRIRNSESITLENNTIKGNLRSGIKGVILDLAHTSRNISLDPYKQALSLRVVGGSIGANKNGHLVIADVDSLYLSGVDFLFPGTVSNSGFSGEIFTDVVTLLMAMKDKSSAISYKPEPKQPQLDHSVTQR